MTATHLRTKSLVVSLLTRQEMLAIVEAMSPEDRARVSPEWLAAIERFGSLPFDGEGWGGGD
jgi:hypothetical protein